MTMGPLVTKVLEAMIVETVLMKVQKLEEKCG